MMLGLLAHTLRGYPRAFIWIATLIGIGTVLLVFAAVLLDSRSTLWRFSEQAQRNVALLAERDLARTLESFDLSLQAVRDGAADREIMALPPKLRHMVLFDRSASAEGLGTMIVLDATGRGVLNSKADTSSSVDLSDRDYFQIHRDSPVDVGLYVSRPFQSRINNGEWRVGLSRRISGPDGSFFGVVAGGVPLASIAALFSRIDLGPDAAIALFRDDGTFIVGNDGLTRAIGSDQSASAIFEKAAQNDAGLFVSAASADGVARLYASRRLANLPLRISVGRAVGPMEAAWWRKTAILTVILALMSLAVVGLVKLLDTELRRRIRAEQRSASLARTDGLTGLANRRMFDEALRREWAVASRAGMPVALMICDIDWFKAFNDRYGHQAGDRALIGVAAVIAKSIRRASDLAARYGGEEFVVLLPGTDISGAATVAETIRLGVHGLAIPHGASANGRVTMSCGVACLVAKPGVDAFVLVEAADEALYRAKQGGRHRAVLHSDQSERRNAAA